ncbi:MAG: hypothetical protein N2Z60_02410 [Elusimicrobiales bacterium]|nr:hypothetical protein [Elusimicrobiales bacterium]HOL62254.1 hypothetical protein [Elusimicrobiales bacterium]HPO96028.1 hypothetical protein [Elusimicrobiales bacterium]
MRIILSILFFSASLFSQSQIIIKKFDWKIHKTEHFDIYFYEDSKPLVNYASKILELAYEKGKEELNPKLDKRIPFFLFASENDMKQNSITEVGDGTGGLTEPYKDRFMVYNDGSKKWLRDVIFHEFGHEVQFSILVDGWWESPKILKTVLYPLWMMEGISENMAGDWDIAMEDMYVRDYTIDSKLPTLEKLYGFSHLKPHQITLGYKTGSAAMRFLSDEYGKDKPSLMLYYFKDAYDINYVLKKLIGTDIEGFDKRFRSYLEFKYFNQIKNEKLFEPYGLKLTQSRDGIPVFNTSPVFLDKNTIAYISTLKGHPPVIVIHNITTGEKDIIDYGLMDIDNIPYSQFTMPVRSLSVSNDKRYLLFSAQKNNKEYLCVYDIKEKKFKKIVFEELDQARQFSFSPDDKKIAFVGMKNGTNNIYEADFNSVLKLKKIKNSDIEVLTEGDYNKISPAYVSKDQIVYICETGDVYDLKNDLCFYKKDFGVKRISLDIDISDIFYDKEKDRIFFVSDKDKIYNIYSYSIKDSKIYKHTSLIGGGFTPYYEDGEILFSYFRHGEVNVYRILETEILYEEIKTEKKEEEIKRSDNSTKDFAFENYRFKASTDLFFPALLFSSPGGLFAFTYYQASDYLGRHNFSAFLNYNSGYPYTNLRTTYLYNRYRTKFVADVSILNAYELDDNTLDVKYDKEYIKTLTGLLYPFDRYKSFGVYFSYKNNKETYDYPYIGFNEKKRGIIASYMNNKLNGLYLTAVYGYYANFILGYYDHMAGGNVRYNSFSSDYLRYLPLSRRSTVVNRLFLGVSNGKDNPEFSYGGVGGIRGFIDNSSNEDKNVLVYNAEARLCLFDMDHYWSFMFPDFYFKALYFKIFSDNAYGWNNSFNDKIKNSVGFGFNLHTFILQRYQMVLSFDWSFNTKTGAKVMYFYLGPVF